MSDDAKERADARLTDAFASASLQDTRAYYRQRLRRLREIDAAAFERALRHYDEVVVPALAGDADPVDVWIDYGCWLQELDGPGRLVAVDAGGRATTHAAPAPMDALVLHVPEDARVPVLPARLPAAPSAAQRATFDLLVAERVELER